MGITLTNYNVLINRSFIDLYLYIYKNLNFTLILHLKNDTTITLSYIKKI